MKKHAPAEEMREELDNLLSKINAMEIIASGEFQKGTVKILRTLVEDIENIKPIYEKNYLSYEICI